MFTEHPSWNIYSVLELTQGDMQMAADMILWSPPLTTLLQKIRFLVNGSSLLLTKMVDELELFHSVIRYYKVPNFDPTLDMRVRFQGQPAVSVPHRQMFTSLFTTFAMSTDLNLFQHDGQFLWPWYCVQNVVPNLMMIAHALALKGIGFICCNYWYVATGNQTQALQYAGLEDVSPHV